MNDISRKQEVYQMTYQKLVQLLAGDDSAVRRELAELRKGIGRVPGDIPKLWGIMFSDLPEYMMGKRGQPSREEWAIYISLTLYALHQQSSNPKTESILINGRNMSLGRAACALVRKDGEDSRERVARRFNQIALADNIQTLAYYLRGFVQLLRANEVALDYPMLARDLCEYQWEKGARSVRLRWGQDFYNTSKDNEDNAEGMNDDEQTE